MSVQPLSKATGVANQFEQFRVLRPLPGPAAGGRRMGAEEDTELLELIRDAGRALGRRLHTDVLSAPTAAQLARQTPGGLVVIATNLADKVGLLAEYFTAPGNDAWWWCRDSETAPARLGARTIEHHRNVKP